MAQFVGFRFQVSGFGCQETGVLNPHMKLDELNSEPQNIEQEISNDEVRNRFALTISD
jgi:hypothetical protein